MIGLPLGARVRTLRDFSLVPAGTTGTIVDQDDHDVVVEWDRPEDVAARHGEPARIGPARRILDVGRDGLRDWFSPDEVTAFLHLEVTP